MDERTLRARAIRAREVLTGETRERGLLKWLQDEVEHETGKRPSPASVHRYLADPPKRVIPPEVLKVLDTLEAEARDALREKLKEMR